MPIQFALSELLAYRKVALPTTSSLGSVSESFSSVTRNSTGAPWMPQSCRADLCARTVAPMARFITHSVVEWKAGNGIKQPFLGFVHNPGATEKSKAPELQ